MAAALRGYFSLLQNSPSIPTRRNIARVVIPSKKRSSYSQRKDEAKLVAMASSVDAAEVKVKWEPSPETLAAWKGADAVCFDVDSTFCTDESIDEVAAFLGVGEQVAELTNRAMGGNVKFQDALRDRLNLMNCSRQDMDRFLAQHPPSISPRIPELVKTLQARGTAVYLVSGGFRVIINPIADMMGIPRENVFANTLIWDEDGKYVGFDAEEFTSQSGGKARAVAHIRQSHGYETVVAIGDGATDLEARGEGAAKIFIGYGGVAFRPKVAEGADWYVKTFDPLLDALQ